MQTLLELLSAWASLCGMTAGFSMTGFPGKNAGDGSGLNMLGDIEPGVMRACSLLLKLATYSKKYR